MADVKLMIAVGQKHLIVLLFRGTSCSDKITMPFSHDLDTMLIMTLDSFLKRNRINPLTLRAVTVRGAIDKFSSVYRIVKTWQNAVRNASDFM